MLMKEVEEKLDKLEELSKRLDSVEFENLRLKAGRALAGWFTYSTSAVIVVSPKGRILDLNNNAKKLFGYPEDDELIKQQIEVLVPETIRPTHVAHRLEYLKNPVFRRMGEGFTMNLQGQRKDGTIFSVAVSLNPINLEGQHLTCAVVEGKTG